MSNIVSVINTLTNLLPLKPASMDEIVGAEEQLGLRFADEYKQYLVEFGAILADGIELTGIAKSKNRNVVSVTLQERELNPNVPNNLYVIENVGIEGIIIWQDENECIYRSTSKNVPIMISPSLVEYIRNKQVS
jgi:riboflavin synthase alpha subunit